MQNIHFWSTKMPGLTYFAPKIFSNPLLLVAGSGFPKLKIGKIRLKSGWHPKYRLETPYCNSWLFCIHSWTGWYFCRHASLHHQICSALYFLLSICRFEPSWVVLFSKLWIQISLRQKQLLEQWTKGSGKRPWKYGIQVRKWNTLLPESSCHVG